MLEVLKEIILDFNKENLETGTKRDINFEVVKKKAFVCIGVRRSGKTTFLYQIIDQLEKIGVKRENILYINFFDDRLTEFKKGKLSLVNEAYFSVYPEKKGKEKIYYFFDEIQEAENWEKFIERLLRTENCEIYISGSSAKMLSQEIATEMRGRSIAWELFPFSFKEFLSAHGVHDLRLDTRNRLLVQKKFRSYWEKGGFPEVLSCTDRTRLKIHQEYYKAILHRDIIERFDAAHPRAVIQTGYRLLSGAATLYTLNRVTDYLKSMGFKLSKEFVGECISWFEDAYFLFSVKKYDRSLAKQNVNPKKIYCVDHGLIHSVTPLTAANNSQILENIVFGHLRRKYNQIYYYRTGKGSELDFLYKEQKGPFYPVQVTYTLGDEKTKKREVTAILLAMKELRLQKGTIVTYNEFGEFVEGKHKIEILPAWKFLIE